MGNRDEDFSEFASARWLSLVRAAVALGCTASEAEDLAQGTLLRAYVFWAKVEKADHRDAYVSRMLVNAHRDSHRSRWRRETAFAEVPDAQVDDTTAASDSADALRRAVGQLSQGQREVLALRYYLRLTEPEIATALGIAQGTVKSRLSRALAALSHSPDLAEFGDTNEPR
ncbi:RNA polymerase sigma factor SigL [Nocardioides szechwanensis]|uniref:RNA polymerase sigma-70 factor, sigma-E family n=1 Tax=Nocardioides szechwanensis TaxID=1005944 RepID=A0A1H0EAE0_9ACTN|nr:SigE family RNA polymerase sigma factor [Nocardioides szechwanensis]GEP34729.1 RNA polymerase sigma factor SigL [Nocardioides szechwanensis]SDN79362.1 RNA polymerase sigma-70 factor, sigma-E family [Nocardioides szechwanensis]